MKQKIIIGISGASGMIYPYRLIEKLKNSEYVEQIGIIFSTNAKVIWEAEIKKQIDLNTSKFCVYENNDFSAPMASGSSLYSSMVIIPSSMGTLGRVANGVSDSLITRCADVMLKEKRKIIFVVRETPYNLIHLENMKQLLLAGSIICPANPSFYSNPQTIENLADTIIDRVIDLLQIPFETYRWGG